MVMYHLPEGNKINKQIYKDAGFNPGALAERLGALTEAEAARRLAQEGYNDLPAESRPGLLKLVWRIIQEPMFILLLAGGAIYFSIGDLKEALMLIFFVCISITITLYQEDRTERSLAALKNLSSPRALVIRDGRQRRIPGRETVRGDLVLIAEGDRVPADSIVLEEGGLQVDESLLTGESAPVTKNSATDLQNTNEVQPPGGDGHPFVYSGMLAERGWAAARVAATGENTFLGKIGKSLKTIQPEKTRLQKEAGHFVRLFAAVGLVLCTLVVLAYGLDRYDWRGGFLAGIALAMAVLPEEIPMVLTVFLALAAWRISQKKVLTRRVPVVEDLGSATVLCVDKTGTLTMNMMTVKALYADGEVIDPSGVQKDPRARELLYYGILASRPEPFDPMETALFDLWKKALPQGKNIYAGMELAREYPLTGRLLAVARAWKTGGSQNHVIAAKGAPEAIFDICHMGQKDIGHFSSRIDALARKGLRIIAVARGSWGLQRHSENMELPSGQHDFEFEFLGLIGLSDPVKPGVAAAVAACAQAGIWVAMITGDYPETAKQIAREAAISHPENVLSGPELEKMPEDELARRVKEVNVFARIMPEQKLKIVNALKASGEVTAMTGDGVNDAPALKAAHIGIAMGARGADVAREAASIVLLDDNISSIVEGVKTGRKTYDNIKKAMVYTLAVHIPIAGLALFPVLAGLPLALLPVHIVFLELIIDPACSIVFEAEPEEPGIMQRPPRAADAPLFGKRLIALGALQGVSVLAVALALFFTVLHKGASNGEARALAFSTLIFANLGLIIANRAWGRSLLLRLKEHNRSFWFVLGGALLFLVLTVYLPFLRGLFLFEKLSPYYFALAAAVGLASALWTEALKLKTHGVG